MYAIDTIRLLTSTPPIIRTGSDGRLRYTPEQRQDLLEAFDRSGLSAMAFSRQHGVSLPDLHRLAAQTPRVRRHPSARRSRLRRGDVTTAIA